MLSCFIITMRYTDLVLHIFCYKLDKKKVNYYLRLEVFHDLLIIYNNVIQTWLSYIITCIALY
jgi:hypothetical protein